MVMTSTIVFDFRQYGDTVFRPGKQWDDTPRSDIILFDVVNDTTELDEGLLIGKYVSLTTTQILCSLIVKHWADL